MIDYHVHTALCNHATGSMEQYIRQAVADGVHEICFLDHLTLHEKGRHFSMAPAEVPLYYYAARRLQDKYRDAIRIRAGLEVDFTPEFAAQIGDIVDRFSFDVIGGSVHFVDEQNIVSFRTARTDPVDADTRFYERYLELVEQMLEYSYFDMVCHIDVVKKHGQLPPGWFYEKMDAILEKIQYKGLVLEINTSGLTHPAKTVYPDPEMLRACHDKQVGVTVGSDAHRPQDVGRHFNHAIALLQSAGYRSLAGFNRRSRYEIPMPLSENDACKTGGVM